MDCYEFARHVDHVTSALPRNCKRDVRQAVAVMRMARSMHQLEQDARSEYTRVHNRQPPAAGSRQFGELLEFMIVEHYAHKLDVYRQAGQDNGHQQEKNRVPSHASSLSKGHVTVEDCSSSSSNASGNCPVNHEPKDTIDYKIPIHDENKTPSTVARRAKRLTPRMSRQRSFIGSPARSPHKQRTPSTTLQYPQPYIHKRVSIPYALANNRRQTNSANTNSNSDLNSNSNSNSNTRRDTTWIRFKREAQLAINSHTRSSALASTASSITSSNTCTEMKERNMPSSFMRPTKASMARRKT